MSSTTLPVCPKTGSTSPSLTVQLCLHTVPGNRECAPASLKNRPSQACGDPSHSIASGSPAVYYAAGGPETALRGAALRGCSPGCSVVLTACRYVGAYVVRHVIIFGRGHGLQRAIIDESQHRTPERLIMAQH